MVVWAGWRQGVHRRAGAAARALACRTRRVVICPFGDLQYRMRARILSVVPEIDSHVVVDQEVALKPRQNDDRWEGKGTRTGKAI